MSKICFCFFKGRYAFLFATVVVLLMLTPLCFGGGQSDDAVSSSVVIDSKEDGGIVIGGRKFVVTEATRIFDLLGKVIPICDLPVPVEAMVEYISGGDQDPECLKIEVTRLLEDSEIGPRSKNSD